MKPMLLPTDVLGRLCRDCRRPLDRTHSWRCTTCIERRIERGGRR